jgi:hypothetical protein
VIGVAIRLNLRTGHRAVGAENATIAWLRPQPRAAVRAFMQIQARVARHGLGPRRLAFGTGQDGFENDAHIGDPYQSVRARSAIPSPTAPKLTH